MKFKFLLIAALLFSCAPKNNAMTEFKVSPIENKKEKTVDAKDSKNKKLGSFDDLTTMVDTDTDFKTFDFERIFKEANKYFEAASSWKILKCTPKSAFICTKRECPKVKDVYKNAYLLLDKKNSTVAVCRAKVCSYLNARFEQTGVFINAWVNEPTGMTVRILGNSRYKQISMIGLDAYITNGECEELKK